MVQFLEGFESIFLIAIILESVQLQAQFITTEPE